jgi:post-segregation antitoxin (ccd killing protein)
MDSDQNLVFDRSAARRAVHLSLNEDLISRAKGLTKNLSATVETLLAGYVREEQEKRRAADLQLQEVIEALNAYHEKHGCLSDEYQAL